MKNEINNEILKFKARWKYHNISVVVGFLFWLFSISIMGFILYTIIFYSGDNKIYCIITELVMYLVAKKLFTNTMPDKETRMLYNSEHYQLNTKIQNMMKNEIINNTINNFIQIIKEKKREEK